MKVFDLHNDLLTSGKDIDENLETDHKVIYAIFSTELKGPLVEVDRLVVQHQSLLLAIEDIFFIKTETDIQWLCSLPIKYASLTWNYSNHLAGGAFSDGDLTKMGKRVIKRLEENKIKIDLAHLNRKSFFKALDFVTSPVVTHTALDCIKPHPRNLTDKQIKEVIALGGLIGLTPVADFMVKKGEAASIDNFANLIDTFVEKFGTSNLALGTDFFGAPKLKGLSSYSDFANLALLLSKKGYTHKQVDQIFYLNATSFFQP